MPVDLAPDLLDPPVARRAHRLPAYIVLAGTVLLFLVSLLIVVRVKCG